MLAAVKQQDDNAGGGGGGGSEEELLLREKYVQQSDREHILNKPGMYIGDVTESESYQYVMAEEVGSDRRIEMARVFCSQGLFKCVDEIFLNAKDHVERQHSLIAREKAEKKAGGGGSSGRSGGGGSSSKPVTLIEVHIAVMPAGERTSTTTAAAATTTTTTTVHHQVDGRTYVGRATIVVRNDGNGIDVVEHPELKVMVPEMIFGHMRTSTNFRTKSADDVGSTVGGQNGYGGKVANIWSSWMRVRTLDHVRGLMYSQEFRDNMAVCEPPQISKLPAGAAHRQPFTEIAFLPDYDRMQLPHGLSLDMFRLLEKRVFDLAGLVTNNNKVRVEFNGVPVPVRGFSQYVDLYLGSSSGGSGGNSGGGSGRVHESGGERWEYAVCMSPTGQFEQVSFVNGICTAKGGRHVEYIVGQVVRGVAALIQKKKKGLVVGPAAVREHLMLFLRCDVSNPTFDSQIKDCLTTPVAKFGSTCVVSESFVDKVAKLGVLDAACSVSEAKENSRNARKTNGSKTRVLRGIPNLIDANLSGTAQSGQCVLILCEGLSAMSGIVSGLSARDRDLVGIFPLKGKVINVRGETAARVADNVEITNLKKILGLETGRDYASHEDVARCLRYGRLKILTDQDLDGSHIKGLILNLFQSQWPSLFRLDGFLSFMNTPIIRARHSGSGVEKVFYHVGEYNEWKESLGTADTTAATTAATTGKWVIKYFKGLGTSTAKEFKEYFANQKVVQFVYSPPPPPPPLTTTTATTERPIAEIVGSGSGNGTGSPSDVAIDKVFNKKKADERKVWLEAYDGDRFLDTSQDKVRYEDFIDKELIHFSKYDCARSIACVVDGLKTSQRKILFSAFKRRLVSEIKVAQFSGYVSEHSCYHHGEASLNGAIVNMAQTFVGSNNLNLLEPNGQFGTRLNGGDDSASERYIYTQLNSPLARRLFVEADDGVLTYLDDDGTPVEPAHYVPVIPFVLFNGTQGIGTGFSCSVPAFDPLDVLDYIRRRRLTTTTDEPSSSSSSSSSSFVPYYEGFTGTIEAIGEGKFRVRGTYTRLGDCEIQINELPVGTWTMPYVSFLESLTTTESTTAAAAAATATNKKSAASASSASASHSTPLLKDVVSTSTEVRVCIRVTFARASDLDKFEKAPHDHKDNLYKVLKLSTTISLTNMHLFQADGKLRRYTCVEDIIDDFCVVRLDTYAKRKAHLLAEMQERYRKARNRADFIQRILDRSLELRGRKRSDIETELDAGGFDRIAGDFAYLLKMQMDSVSAERAEALVKEKTDIETEIQVLGQKSERELWSHDLDLFETAYRSYRGRREREMTAPPPATTSAPSSGKRGGRVAGAGKKK